MSSYTSQDRIADRLRLPALDLEIKTLENALAALFTERNDIQARLDAHIYPVLTLPNEIVSEIFLQYIPLHPSPLGDSSPIKLTQICSKWRHIAHGTPTLWQTIQLPDSAGYQRRFSPNCVSTVEAWLSRSAALPLSVAFGGFDYEGDWAMEGAKLWDVLVAQCARWKYAKLNLENARGWLHEPLSQILEIDVRVPGTSESDPAGEFIPTTAIPAPKLATAIVRDVYDLRILNFLPWVQLTALSLRQVSVSQAAAIVPLATSLVKCRLDMVDEENRLDIPVPPIILPELETMIFDFWDDWDDPQVLFLALRAPASKTSRYSQHSQTNIGPRFSRSCSRTGNSASSGYWSLASTDRKKRSVIERYSGIFHISNCKKGRSCA
ncbi:F-box domain-containing protein [Mycena kentingensis (nom. inval.)]|nr:F-box domain-containing protein [Mycena kentingensis (nom. inval.)]